MLPAGRGGALLDIGTHKGEFTARVAERVGATESPGIELIEEHADAARARGIEVVVRQRRRRPAVRRRASSTPSTPTR